MYAYFNLNERDFLRLLSAYRKRIKEKGLDPAVDPANKADIKVFMGLAGDIVEGIASSLTEIFERSDSEQRPTSEVADDVARERFMMKIAA